MKKLSLLFALCVFQTAFAQKDNRIVIGTNDSLRSTILNETRRIMVYVPNRNNNGLFGSHNYPVIYLLDGEDHFHSVTGLLDQLATKNSLCPEMIVVGIPNTNRTRDLTPTHSTLDPDGRDAGFLATSGGGEAFTRFLERELIPYVDAHYPTVPHRMLIGHSFGGLLVVNTLVHHPELFNTYVAIDPSMWWDSRKLLGEASAILQTDKLKGKSLFLGVANTMPAGMDTTKLALDTTGNTSHIRSILQFAKKAAASTGGLHFDWKYYPNDSHGSVPLITEYDGLRFLFDYYRPPMMNDPGKMTPGFLVAYYKNMSEKIGYPISPPEDITNAAGYTFLQQKSFENAFAFFKMNVDNYPKSFNVYDSMGDYYVAKNDNAKAREYFTKALALREFPETRKKLEKLKVNPK